MSIIHLYKCPAFFEEFKDIMICAMEKIHGTSTHIAYSLKDKKLICHSGGERNSEFIKIFDLSYIETCLNELVVANDWKSIKIHGECYAGKQQQMSATYGNVLKFIVFDVKINNEYFLPLAEAVKITEQLKLEFVPYNIGPCTPEWIESQANMPSVQAQINGCGDDKLREGVVIKPLDEKPMSDGTRAIFKHKNAHFWETKVPGRLTVGQGQSDDKQLNNKLTNFKFYEEIADNWVTEMRGHHVIDKMMHIRSDDNKVLVIKDIKEFIEAMVADVKKESIGEIEWDDTLEGFMRKKAGKLFHVLNNFKVLSGK